MFESDSNGNRYKDAGKTAEFDLFNRMVKYTDENGAETTYTYTASGLRESKTTSDGVQTFYVWDGGNMVLEYVVTDSDNLVGEYRKFYIYGADGLAYRKDLDGSIYTYNTNYRGDVLSVMDEEQNIKAEYIYDAYGNLVESSIAAGFSDNFGYRGEYHDPESGYIYLRNRYLDPKTGSFTTEDPIRDGLNWFSYCGGNPVKFTDPWGLWEPGDEKLTPGAQTYTKFYGEQWEKANTRRQACIAAGDTAGAEAAQAEMDNWHALANDIRTQDAAGTVQGATLAVPVYNQYNTVPMDETNELCWANSAAMVASFQLGDTTDRTLSIATGVAGSTIIDNYNVARAWKSTAKLGLGITAGQSQISGILTESQIQISIKAEKPFGVLYGNYYIDHAGVTQWSGHWIVGIGYASAPGHNSLVVSNDPAGGVQRIQTYNDFKGNYIGDPTPWRPWAETAR